MKKLAVLACMILLGACSSTDYEELTMSTAEISKLEVNEVNMADTGIHRLDIKFNYVIDQFNEGDHIYHCSVQFLTYDDKTVTTFMGEDIPCLIKDPSGEQSVFWNTPFDKNMNPRKKLVAKLKAPVQYFIALHQLTGDSSSQIIGRSKILDLKSQF